MMSEYEGKSEIFAAAIELPITSGYMTLTPLRDAWRRRGRCKHHALGGRSQAEKNGVAAHARAVNS